MVEAQAHRRFIKTHLPVDALVFSPRAKYIYIARDGRDVIWSMYNHHSNGNQAFYDLLNETPGLVGPRIEPPPASVRQYFNDWVERDGFPFWSFWENLRTWWEIRHLPNVMLLHFSELKADMPGQIRRIAEFLDIEVDEARWPAILDHCSFDYMKRNAELSAPLGGASLGRRRLDLHPQGRQRPLARRAERRGKPALRDARRRAARRGLRPLAGDRGDQGRNGESGLTSTAESVTISWKHQTRSGW